MRNRPRQAVCRIIGIGSNLIHSDSAGPETLRLLASMNIQDDIELIDGGLGGLNLLPMLENVNRVIFVDGIEGFLDGPGIMVIRLPSEKVKTGEYGHNAGLGYLMAVAPKIIEPPMPDCWLVGVEGKPGEKLCSEAARTCLLLTGSP